MEKKTAKKTIIFINIFIILFIVVLLVTLGIYFLDDLKLLSTYEGQLAFKDKIRNAGVLGYFIIIIVNMFQVIVAFIPGEFIEIICGMLYGPLLGVVICLIGFTLGTICIFGLVKLLGKPFFDSRVDNKKKIKLKFLEQETRALIIIFFVFLIPGTPKDFITYAIPFTKIKMIPFILVTSVARIPSILTSTIVGSAIITGDNKIAFIVSVVTLVIATIGIIFNKVITNKIENIVMKYQNKKKKV